MAIDPDKFYGTSAPAPAPSAPATIATGATGATGAAQAEAPEQNVADLFYGSTESAVATYAPQLRDQIEVLASHMGASPEQRTQMETNASELFYDARLTTDEATALHTMFVTHAKAPADESTRNGWAADTMTQLQQRYGDSADSRLAIAQRFVQERPELAQILASTGLGSHPDVVLKLVEKSHHLRFRGAKK